jgi:hypothetical protein
VVRSGPKILLAFETWDGATGKFFIMLELAMFLKSLGDGYPMSPSALCALLGAFVVPVRETLSVGFDCVNHGLFRCGEHDIFFVLGVMIVQATVAFVKHNVAVWLDESELVALCAVVLDRNFFFTCARDSMLAIALSLYHTVP